MNAELKAKWLEALRSGEYEQCQGLLNNGRGRFCCLGVLCEVYGLRSERISEDDSARRYLFQDGLESLYGLRGELRRAVGEAEETTADMNDTGKSFAEIADWIDANIPAEGGGQ